MKSMRAFSFLAGAALAAGAHCCTIRDAGGAMIGFLTCVALLALAAAANR